MQFKKRAVCLALAFALLLSACGVTSGGSAAEGEHAGSQIQAESPSLRIGMDQWQYNEEDDVYWQVGLVYCDHPADEAYESLGIYVPGAYLTGTENGDGTYTCQVNTSGTVGGYTAETAPIVLPVDTPGYAAMPAPTGYSGSVSSYTNAGFVYVSAGCRGRESGAPAGVTDLKAAIRYIRHNADLLPGSTDRIFSFGMSGGGAQSALLGVTGDSDLYTPYLEAIGAVHGVSDAVAGSMCWCPITNLDYASEAYEWNLGVTRTGLTEEMQALSDAMAEQFALYINELGLKDGEGNALLLTASEEGVYQAGSYYEYLKSVIEASLNNFLEDTTFPYTAGSGGKGAGGDLPDLSGGDGMAGGKGGFGNKGGLDGDGAPDGGFTGGKGGLDGKAGLDGDGALDGGRGGFDNQGGPDGDLPALDGDLPALDGTADYSALDGIDRNETSGGITLSGTYETVQDYIDALNAEATWVTYDSETNTASITDIASFVSALKLASKDLGAFDALDATQGENILFGFGDGSGAHFDAAMAALLAGTDYEAAYAEDLAAADALGNSMEYRVNMYNPLYYLSSFYEGYQTSNVASYWRIRTGINQSDTALTTEVNLALALENYGAEVDFATVWGQAHVEAERTGDSTTNFIEWVNVCCQ